MNNLTFGLNYDELLNLQKQVATALEEKAKNGSNKKEWLASKVSEFLPRIEALRKKYEKLAVKCSKAKSIVLRVKMDVDVTAPDFDELLSSSWQQAYTDMFEVTCEGALLNDNCGNLGEEIQNNIDDVMDNVCSTAIDLHGDLAADAEVFAEEYNTLLRDLESAGGNTLKITLEDIAKAATKTAKKGKK